MKISIPLFHLPMMMPMDQDEERDGVPFILTRLLTIVVRARDASQVDNLTEFVFLVDLPKSNCNGRSS